MAVTSLSPRPAPTIRRLADLRPAYSGDRPSALLAMADDYQGRLHTELARSG